MKGPPQGGAAFHRRAWSFVLITMAFGATIACIDTSDSADSTGRGGSAVVGPAAPVATETPIGVDEPIRAPSARAEPLLGKAIVLVDSSSKSVYEFDTVRGRFRGPAPEVALPDRRVALPGYPIPIGNEFPQNAAIVGNQVVIAGGLDGTAVFLDRSKGDLAIAWKIELPVRDVVLEDTGKRATNADSEFKRPLILLMSPFGADHVIAVSRENALSTSVGYVIDPVSRRLLASGQLPGGLAANAVVRYRDAAIAAMATKKLVFLSKDLGATREIALPGNPTSLAIEGDTAYVSLLEPTMLLKVELASGRITELRNKAEETIGGPVVVEGGIVWWAHTKLGRVTRLDTSTGDLMDMPACESISSMLRHEGALYVACPGKKTLALMREGQPLVSYRVDGFPISIAGPF